MAINILNSVILSCYAIFIFFWFISAFFVKKSVKKRNWGLSILWRLVLIVVVIIIVGSKNLQGITFIFSDFLFKNPITDGIGTILVVIGLLIALWARITLGRNWSGYVTYKKEHELVTNGPYRVIRHPIYFGMILMFFGTFLNISSVFVLIIMFIVSIFYISRIKREEEIMIKLFGKKYLDYKKNSKAIIPYII